MRIMLVSESNGCWYCGADLSGSTVIWAPVNPGPGTESVVATCPACAGSIARRRALVDSVLNPED
jgi:hypothetical protein